MLVLNANDFDKRIEQETGTQLCNVSLDTLQVNVGLKCNQACGHCHVSSSPARTEMMDWPTMQLVINAARSANCRQVDITGGAPELNKNLPRLIEVLRKQGQAVQVRTNLTALLDPELEAMAQFFADHQVKLVASLPCYLEHNVDKQRGTGAFDKSVRVIKRLNTLGYGSAPELPLDLVYNPLGPFLPPDQSSLEAVYKSELNSRFGIVFTRLITITNMPIGRFLIDLQRQGKAAKYMQTLSDSFNVKTVDRLMCRRQIEVDWDGYLYDCDFNLAIKLGLEAGVPRHIRDFNPSALVGRKIATGNHCFGCTAGNGSSCEGALVERSS